MLRAAIQQIKRPLEYSAKNGFANIDRVRDLEKTVSIWAEHIVSSELTAQQEKILRRFTCLFSQYDEKITSEKIQVIQSACRLLEQLDAPATPSHDTRQQAVASSSPIPQQNNRQHTKSLKQVSQADESKYDLATLIQYVKGVGPKRARLLNKIGIYTVKDALFVFPRRYEDRRRIEKIARLLPGDTPRTVYGTVKTSGVTRTPKQKTQIFELIIGDNTGLFTAKWFNQGYLKKIFTPGLNVVLSGKIRVSRSGRLEMIQPEYELLGTTETEEELLHTGRIVPIYPLTERLYQKGMRRIMKSILDQCAALVEESLPETIRRKYQLLALQDALQRLHFPDHTDDIELLNREKSPAHQRLIFEEFFLLELGIGLKRHYTLSKEKGIAFRFQGNLEGALRQSLDFSLTSAQNRVIHEIQHDLRSIHVMNRLLQGDVGSGKTLVALIALLSAIEAGYQGVIMVPTEILAEQHFRKISTYLQRLNQHLTQEDSRSLGTLRESEQSSLFPSTGSGQITTCLLTGGMRKKERETQLLHIQRGEMSLIVGTHALLQHDVIFHNLGCVVIDEQHKFGVMQRATIKTKGYNPDVLIMTATPIPRTLSLTLYGDLDVSILDELPPGRTPVVTKRFYEKSRDNAYRLITNEIKRNRQAYIVYPLVEESEKLDLKAATEMSEHLSKEVFPEYSVGLVHGRMKAEKKDQQMLAFKNHELDILVSTTVLEVGIDVPNATVMLIEHAERFGLSQLHQLRGRVGRGSSKSYCLLMTSYPMSADARKRLDAMVETTDGFIIAERDLEIRGPGEFFGTKQSGLPDLNIANLIRDVKLLECAREEAFAIIRDDPGLLLPQHRLVKNALEQRWKKSLDLISVG